MASPDEVEQILNQAHTPVKQDAEFLHLHRKGAVWYEEKITSLRKNALETLIEDEKRFYVNPTAAWKDILTQSRMNGEYTELQYQRASAKVRQMTKRHEQAEQDENKTCQERDEYTAQVRKQRGKKYEDTRPTDEEPKTLCPSSCRG